MDPAIILDPRLSFRASTVVSLYRPHTGDIRGGFTQEVAQRMSSPSPGSDVLEFRKYSDSPSRIIAIVNCRPTSPECQATVAHCAAKVHLLYRSREGSGEFHVAFILDGNTLPTPEQGLGLGETYVVSCEQHQH